MKPAQGHVFVAGSANLDFVARAPHVPAPGETVLGRGLELHPGGKGANQALACARAGGASTHMLVALGDDAFGATLESSLRDADVQLHIVRAAGTATGTAFICVSDEAENAITVAPGANDTLAPHHLPPLGAATHLLLQLETPLESVEAYARAARDAGVRVVLNAAPARRLPASLLSRVDLLVVNEGELAMLAGTDDIAQGLERAGVNDVVVTLGARGCIARSGDATHLQPAFRVKAVDTTAAGDTFCGALVARLSAGDALDVALRYACAASALACTRAGAQSSVPTRDEVVALLAATKEHLAADRDALAAHCGVAAASY
ncbi:ribokinase [Lysobacter arvi]|uniref:Ribokinase n=1 Tax=Lysobacter arvi TaxID=3038776 RepID=A0ABU1CA90_9GAMM|nr:ribokinase [Lysobacter arvi]MDR0182106.1 ribokinase [Lysobacter arvi]